MTADVYLPLDSTRISRRSHVALIGGLETGEAAIIGDG
jgi:hypothetical protein